MGWNHQPVLQLWVNWHPLNSSLRIDKFLFRNCFLPFFWWITFNPAAKHATEPPSRSLRLLARPFWKPQLALCGSCAWSTGSSHYWGWCNLVQNDPFPACFRGATELPELRSYLSYQIPKTNSEFSPEKLPKPIGKDRLPTIISKCYKLLLFSFHHLYNILMDDDLKLWSLETARHMNQSCFRIHLTFNYPTKQIVHSHK